MDVNELKKRHKKKKIVKSPGSEVIKNINENERIECSVDNKLHSSNFNKFKGNGDRDSEINQSSFSSIQESDNFIASNKKITLIDDGGKDDDYKKDHSKNNGNQRKFVVNIELDFLSFILFSITFCTRVYKLWLPKNIVFDELHYGKFVSLYVKNTFFFDQHPPLGKQLIAAVAHLIGYNGNFTFSRIGAQYTASVPIFWLRLLPAICGSFLPVVVYKLLLEAKLNRWSAFLGGILIILDNALLTQSRFILMEPMLILFSSIGILFLLKFQKSRFFSVQWILHGFISAIFLTLSFSVKYAGFYTYFLAFLIMCRFLWDLLLDKTVSYFQIYLQAVGRLLIFTIVPLVIYILIFYVHLTLLHKAGPHDSVMTSAFQASLDGGLASITKGQPLNVVHGSQITLRHTHGRMCWLHSHPHVYPVRYSNKRGSSHQQQVTCYSFKDVNNWWIVKRPDRDDLIVDDSSEPIKHGDIIQLVHGITSRALNTHDVAAPMTPTNQEVSCYIDYNISMPGQLLWRLEIINKDTEGIYWHAIRSQIRLIHVNTSFALRFSGRQLPEWGFNQHEIVADKVIEQEDTVWNVEEHRYTKTEDQKELERQMINAEMIPTSRTVLSFWDKFVELQAKMLWYSENLQSHMYSSEPLEWPLLDKGIAYWVDLNSNAQIHLIGNILIWYSGVIAIVIYCLLLIFYLMRRQRLYYDVPYDEWIKFRLAGELFAGGYLVHYLPYYFVDRTLFLHNYLPAFIFKLLLLCFVVEHFDFIINKITRNRMGIILYRIIICTWILYILYVYNKFLVLSYGTQKLNATDLINLRWKDTWDFILHRDLN